MHTHMWAVLTVVFNVFVSLAFGFLLNLGCRHSDVGVPMLTTLNHTDSHLHFSELGHDFAHVIAAFLFQTEAYGSFLLWQLSFLFFRIKAIFIDRVAGEIIHLVASVCVCVCVCVCPFVYGALLLEAFDLRPWFWRGGRPWHWIVGQGQTVKIVYALLYEPVVWSRSIFLHSACRVQPVVIANDHYQSIGIVCLSVIRARSTCRT